MKGLNEAGKILVVRNLLRGTGTDLACLQKMFKVVSRAVVSGLLGDSILGISLRGHRGLRRCASRETLLIFDMEEVSE